MTAPRRGIDRRRFIATTAGTAAAGLLAGARSSPAAAAADAGAPDAAGMRTATLPRSGRKMPVFGFGTGPYIPELTTASEADKIATIRYAYDRGVRYFDTAHVYQTEALVGRALADVRDQVYISTKVSLRDPETVPGQLEQSFADLGTEVIDCVKLHCPSNYEVAMRVLDMLEPLKAHGRIIHLGMSNHIHFETAHRLIDSGRLDEVLLVNCYFPRGYWEIVSQRNREFLELAVGRAHQLGMNVIGMKALGCGMFARPDLLAPGYDLEKARRLPGAALRWALSDDRFHVHAIGIAARWEIDADVALCSGDLTSTADDRLLLADYSTRLWDAELIKALPALAAYPGQTEAEARRLTGRTDGERKELIDRWVEQAFRSRPPS